MSGLTDFQVEVDRLFFYMHASDVFLLAGGSALLASGLSTRPTHDLDFFGQRGRVDILVARDQLEAAVADRGWTSERVQEGEAFVRLRIAGADELIVDLAIDSAPGRPPVVSMVGPTYDPEELAGRKLTIDRLADVDLPNETASSADLRAFFHAWADRLAATADE